MMGKWEIKSLLFAPGWLVSVQFSRLHFRYLTAMNGVFVLRQSIFPQLFCSSAPLYRLYRLYRL